MKKVLYIVLIFLGILGYISLYPLSIIVDTKYVPYCIFIIGYISTIIFPIGLFNLIKLNK